MITALFKNIGDKEATLRKYLLEARDRVASGEAGISWNEWRMEHLKVSKSQVNRYLEPPAQAAKRRQANAAHMAATRAATKTVDAHVCADDPEPATNPQTTWRDQFALLWHEGSSADQMWARAFIR
jgi:hypothetical protein